MERRKFTFYPWNLSSTGCWSSESLSELKNGMPEDLAEMLWEKGIYAQGAAMIELIEHGNPRKAAEVARVLVKNHPAAEDGFKKIFGSQLDLILRVPLDNLPSRPQEYPNTTEVGYVQ
jgi:hypothetical protein